MMAAVLEKRGETSSQDSGMQTEAKTTQATIPELSAVDDITLIWDEEEAKQNSDPPNEVIVAAYESIATTTEESHGSSTKLY